jgi:glutamate dehydrogenase
MDGSAGIGETVETLRSGLAHLDRARGELLKAEGVQLSRQLRDHIALDGVDPALVDNITRLAELDGAIGTAALAREIGVSELDVTHAYVALGEALGLDWAKAEAARYRSSDAWDRLLVAGLVREFSQLRLDFLARHGGKSPAGAVKNWLDANRARIGQFADLVARARGSAAPSAAMFAQIAAQARRLLMR